MLQLILLAAVPFIWFGMVAAISFLETPLKFRAPGMSVPLGVGIGRIVYRALNGVETVLAATVLAALMSAHRELPPACGAALVAAAVLLAVQLLVLRPRMAHRTRELARAAATVAASMAPEAAQPRTQHAADPRAAEAAQLQAPQAPRVATAPHLLFIGAEVLKAAALLTAGFVLLASVVG
ncbi:MAG: hypothetical protein ACHP7K_11675 [Actinomycetales bacterium]